MKAAAPAERTALYRVYGEADLLLYIGISKDFGTRWKQHARVQPWWGEMCRMEVVWHQSRPDADKAETAAIKTEQPRFNVMHNGAVRPQAAGRSLQHPSDERLGAKLRDLRGIKRMSQDTLAMRMTHSGYPWHKQTVGRVEAGLQPVRFGELEALADIFGFDSLDALIPVAAAN